MSSHVRAVLSVLLWSAVAMPAVAADWPVVPPAHAALKTPQIDPAADAEVLLWDVRITDEMHRRITTFNHHLRIKIFTERGREAHASVELPYFGRRRVRDIEGRTIGPDGKITELRDQDVFERTIVQTSGVKVRAKTFVLPAAVPGSIIEYRWREIRDDTIANYLELAFQREIPVHVAHYHLKPLNFGDIGYRMRTQGFNLATVPVPVREDGGYYGITARNLPALKKEPFMPPELSLKAWMLVFYADVDNDGKTPLKFWTDYAKSSLNNYKPHLKATNDVLQASAELRKGGAPTIEKVVAYVRQHIKRDDTDTAPAGEAKYNKTATDALKRGTGSGIDLTLTAAAIGAAAGLDVRLAMVQDRSEHLVAPEDRQPYFLDHVVLAVKTGDNWRYVDPANEYAKDGHLNWVYEGNWALVLDDKEPLLLAVPVSPEGQSLRTRTAALTLSEDGTLAGDVIVTYTGQQATARREFDDDETPQDREKAVVDALVKRLPGATVSKVAFENLTDADQPYKVSYSLTVPGYAQRTGSRLFVEPGMLQRGVDAMFSDSTRTHVVLLPYAYRDTDIVTIALPQGFEVEANGTVPPPAQLVGGAALYASRLDSATAGRLTYTRMLTVGSNSKISFTPAEYSGLKAFFDLVRRSDGHTVTLRRAAAPAK